MSAGDEQRAMGELSEFLCADCSHVAHRHVAFVGPCSDCWEECLPICRKFRMKDEDTATVDAILRSVGA